MVLLQEVLLLLQDEMTWTPLVCSHYLFSAQHTFMPLGPLFAYDAYLRFYHIFRACQLFSKHIFLKMCRSEITSFRFTSMLCQ